MLSQEGQRFIVPLDEVNPVVVDALLSAEDRRFYEHGGLDPIGIGRALVSNLRSSGTQGGSTLTQQLVKNEYLSSERTFVRKAREAVLSVKLERSRGQGPDPRALPQHRVLRSRAPTASRPPPAPTSTCTPPTSTPARPRCSSACCGRPESADPVEDMEEAEARRANVHRRHGRERQAQPGRGRRRRSPRPIEATDRTAPTPPTAGLAPHFVEWVRQQVVAELGRGRALRPRPARRDHARPRRPARRRGGGRRGDHRPRRSRRPRSSRSTRTAPSAPTSAAATTRR